MTVKAYVEHDVASFGLRLAVTRTYDEQTSQVFMWERPSVQEVQHGEAAPDGAWLQLDHEVAQAIYIALADHFGHSGSDTRALRRDYEAERARVDKFIAHLTDGTR